MEQLEKVIKFNLKASRHFNCSGCVSLRRWYEPWTPEPKWASERATNRLTQFICTQKSVKASAQRAECVRERERECVCVCDCCFYRRAVPRGSVPCFVRHTLCRRAACKRWVGKKGYVRRLQRWSVPCTRARTAAARPASAPGSTAPPSGTASSGWCPAQGRPWSCLMRSHNSHQSHDTSWLMQIW